MFLLFCFPFSDLDVQSPEKDNEGRPLLQLFPPTVCVRSFSQLSKLVKLADNKKMEEVQACLEGEHDDHRLKFESDLHYKVVQPPTYLHIPQT